MPRRARHDVAYAVVELEDARDELRTGALAALSDDGTMTSAGLRARMEIGSRSIEAALKRLADVRARLEQDTPGLPVSEVARYLELSEPTVRAWLTRRVLTPVAETKPVLVDIASLRRVGRALAELRERGVDRDWTRALVDYLHDRETRSNPALDAGLQELRRGDVEEA